MNPFKHQDVVDWLSLRVRPLRRSRHRLAILRDHTGGWDSEDARWVGREAVLAAMNGQDPDLRPARQGSIARFLLERWLADTLD